MGYGIELAGAFWHECVRPSLGPLGDQVSAALLGHGSEVLGFDDTVSADHDFGPRLQLVVPDEMDASPLVATGRSVARLVSRVAGQFPDDRGPGRPASRSGHDAHRLLHRSLRDRPDRRDHH